MLIERILHLSEGAVRIVLADLTVRSRLPTLCHQIPACIASPIFFWTPPDPVSIISTPPNGTRNLPVIGSVNISRVRLSSLHWIYST